MSDAYWDQTVLLLHCMGGNNSTYFRDERHNIVTRHGNPVISTAFPAGGSSAHFDGVADYLTLAPSSKFTFAADFSIQFKVKLDRPWADQPASCGLIGGSSGEWCIYKDGGKPTKLNFRICGIDCPSTSTPGMEEEDWEISRADGVIRLFRNGVLDASYQNTSVVTGTPEINIGRSATWNGFFAGFLREIRVTNLVARHIADFTPLTVPFPHPAFTDPHWASVVLSMPLSAAPGTSNLVDLKNHPSQIKSSGNVPTFTSASAKFNGSSLILSPSSYVDIAPHPDFALGAGDFTAEIWTKPGTIVSNDYPYISFINADGNGNGLTLSSGDGTDLWVYLNGLHVKTITGLPLNTWSWFHFAIVRLGPDLKIFVNENLAGTYSIGATPISQNNRILLNSNTIYTSPGHGFNGVRLTKGIARYPAEFPLLHEPFPFAVPQALSGSVHDVNALPLQRTVRSYRRDTGQLVGTAVSDPITGVFALPADSTDEHFVVVFDDTQNAMVYDHITPVI